MIFYITYLLMLLAFIAFSPTREFSIATIAFFSILPCIVYSLVKYVSKLQTYLLLLLILSFYSGIGNNFNLEWSGHRLSDINLIASSAIWLMSYVTFKLGLKSNIPRVYFKYYFCLFFLIGFYIMIGQLSSSRSLEEGSNSAYYVLPVLPLVMYYFPKYKFHILIFTFLVLFTTIKRSSIIIIFLSILWIIYCWHKGIIHINMSKSKICLLIVCGCLLLIIVGGVYLTNIIGRFSDISEDGGSHRDLIYLFALDILNESDVHHLIFGHGPRYFWFSNSKISAAHNDYLEISVSCGLLGLFIFLLIQIQLITWLIKLIKMRNSLAFLFGINYICFFVWNMVGCQFAYQGGAIGICMFWALVENIINKYENNTIYRNLRGHFRRFNEYSFEKN